MLQTASIWTDTPQSRIVELLIRDRLPGFMEENYTNQGIAAVVREIGEQEAGDEDNWEVPEDELDADDDDEEEETAEPGLIQWLRGRLSGAG